MENKELKEHIEILKDIDDSRLRIIKKLKTENQELKELLKESSELLNYYGNRMDSGGSARSFKQKLKDLGIIEE
jgi:hypothetical protein